MLFQYSIFDYNIPIPQVFSTLMQDLIRNQKGLRPLTVSPRQQPSEYGYYQIYGYDVYKTDEGLVLIDLKAVEAEIGKKCLSSTGVHGHVLVQAQKGFLTGDVANIGQVPSTEALLHNCHDLVDFTSKDLYRVSTYIRGEAFVGFVLGDVVRDGNQQRKLKATNSDVQDVWKIMRGDAIDFEFKTRQTM
ncbi:uncharacterized protein CC84DRAFT_1171849 [Paraphaeosphaeria sporulosa]|uniref:Uncharacterized protein n=1 Tax=Paraphaeosphaeria sporulosa TaxID=1460663 RepID=A0A177CNY1_9PLEO|nr:uncharacterized protein CC84DRAFT_1171849 [Paraphaeosphaeria sporulosa]OAG09245.1 hypothetical protein CC84DRAFT_1171849 [Paraphaeosphaeria sporulosa]